MHLKISDFFYTNGIEGYFSNVGKRKYHQTHFIVNLHISSKKILYSSRENILTNYFLFYHIIDSTTTINNSI